MKTYRVKFKYGLYFPQRAVKLFGVTLFWVDLFTEDGYFVSFYNEMEAHFHIEQIQE